MPLLNSSPLRQLLFLAALAISITRVPAAVIITGTPNQPGGSAQLTQNLTFGVATAGNAAGLVFDNWIPATDTEQDLAMAAGTQQLSFRINGGPVQTVGILGLVDNFANGTNNDVTETDGFLYFSSPIALPSGSTITILAGSINLDSIPATFNPASIQAFTGQARLVDSTAVAVTTLVGVGPLPEPGTTALLLGGVGILLLQRKRRPAKA